MYVEGGRLVLEMGSPLTGVHRADAFGPAGPPAAYELELVGRRELGTDFWCGLTFPVGDAALTLVLGGWGGVVCGFSSLDGADASENESQAYRDFPLGQEATVRLVVRPDRVQAFVHDAIDSTNDLPCSSAARSQP